MNLKRCLSVSQDVFKSRQVGFSLVELMIALVLGLLVVAGAIQVFIGGKQVFNKMEGLASRQEALRFFSDIVSVDARTSSSIIVDEAEIAALDAEDFPCARHVSTSDNAVLLEYLAVSDDILREGDLYCSSPEKHLKEVLYYSSGSSIYACYSCVDDTFNFQQSASAPVFTIQDNISAEFELPLPGVLKAKIVFEDAPNMGPVGQPDSDRTFVFHAVSRREVIDLIESQDPPGYMSP